MSSWPKGRTKAYTTAEIAKLKCIRCNGPAVFQWSICADGNVRRPLCAICDISLNALVLEWAKDPDAEVKIDEYKKRVFNQ